MLNSNPDWSGKYLDFVGLKKLINNLSSQQHDNDCIRDDIYDEMMTNVTHDLDHAAESFLKKVEAMAVSVGEFYHQKRNELDHDFARLQQKTAPQTVDGGNDSAAEISPLVDQSNGEGTETLLVVLNPSDLEQVRRDICDLFTQYHNLRTYAHLNCTGIRKIVKKYDKVMNASLVETYLGRLKAMLPFWDGCLEINQSMDSLKETFAHFFCRGDVKEAERRMNILLLEFVTFQRRSVWLDVQEINRKHEEMQMSPNGEYDQNTKEHSAIQVVKSNRKVQMGIFIVLIFLWILWWPGIFDDDPVKRNALAMLVFVSLLWATEILPLFVTAMLPPFLSVVLKLIVDDGVRLNANDASKVVFSSMFSHVIMLLIGGCSIAAALTKHNIAKLAASSISRQFGTNIQNVLLVNMFIATFASMWISNVAAPVLCISLIEPILKSASAGKSRASFGTSQWMSAEQDDRLCRALILGIALASNVGGMASPISSPQNLFAIEYAPIGWLQWFAVSIPLCVTLDLTIWAWLVFCFDLPSADSVAVTWALQRDRSGSKGLSIEQYFVVVVSVGVVLLWCLSVSLSSVFGQMGILGIIPFIMFFGTGILSKEDLNNFLWGVIFLAMGGLVLGEAIKSSGLADAFAESIASFVESKSLSPWQVMCIFTFLIFVSTTFMSHTVGAIVFLPVAHAVGVQMMPSHATELVFAGALACSSAMGLPVSGFPNMTAIGVEDKLGSRYLTTNDFLMYAVPASIFAWATVVTLAYGLMLLAV
jgi:phosphate transporter